MATSPTRELTGEVGGADGITMIVPRLFRNRMGTGGDAFWTANRLLSWRIAFFVMLSFIAKIVLASSIVAVLAFVDGDSRISSWETWKKAIPAGRDGILALLEGLELIGPFGRLTATILIQYGIGLLSFFAQLVLVAWVANRLFDKAVNLRGAVRAALARWGAVLFWGALYGGLDLIMDLPGWEENPMTALIVLSGVLAALACMCFLAPALVIDDCRGPNALASSVRAFCRGWLALAGGAIRALVGIALFALFTSLMLGHSSVLHALGHNHMLTDWVLIALLPVKLLPWLWVEALVPMLAAVLYIQMQANITSSGGLGTTATSG